MYEETAVISSFFPLYSSFTGYIYFLISAFQFFKAFYSVFHSFLHSVNYSSHVGALLSFSLYFSTNIDNKCLSLSFKAMMCFLLENPYICLIDLPVCVCACVQVKCSDSTNRYISTHTYTHLLKSCSICLQQQILCLSSFSFTLFICTVFYFLCLTHLYQITQLRFKYMDICIANHLIPTAIIQTVS